MSSLHYYITGNTAKGLVNHLDTNLLNISRIVALEHPSARLKTDIIKKLAKQYEHNSVEVLESSLGNDYLDGNIIREKSLAFLDKRIATTSTATINLEEIFPLKKQDVTRIDKLTQKAYESFAEGLKIHDDLEDIYIKQMDFNHADKFAKEFIANLLNDAPKQSHNPHTYTRLFGTNTADGVVNVVPHLIKDIKNVYYIKGRAGTGKSTFMKKIAAACIDHGFDVELYYCSFDPNSVDMVLVRDLDFCIFDSTDPHEFFPKREGEVIVDLYDELVTPGTDEKFTTAINDLHTRYKSFMKEGVRYLKEAGDHRRKIEEQYMANVTGDAIREFTQSIKVQ